MCADNVISVWRFAVSDPRFWLYMAALTTEHAKIYKYMPSNSGLARSSKYCGVITRLTGKGVEAAARNAC